MVPTAGCDFLASSWTSRAASRGVFRDSRCKSIRLTDDKWGVSRPRACRPATRRRRTLRRETAPAPWFRTMRPFHCAAALLVAALAITAAASVAAQRRPSALTGTTVLVRLPPQMPEQGYVGED